MRFELKSFLYLAFRFIEFKFDILQSQTVLLDMAAQTSRENGTVSLLPVYQPFISSGFSNHAFILCSKRFPNFLRIIIF
jgi:hypothetical protein